jgi:hypothetical protein
MTVADYDDHGNKKADDSDMGCVATAACSGRRQAWQATDHFERLLEEACPNHTYQIKHKLKDCDMMKNFMTSVSLTRGRELEEDPSRYYRCPSLGKLRSRRSMMGAPLRGGTACPS